MTAKKNPLVPALAPTVGGGLFLSSPDLNTVEWSDYKIDISDWSNAFGPTEAVTGKRIFIGFSGNAPVENAKKATYRRVIKGMKTYGGARAEKSPPVTGTALNFRLIPTGEELTAEKTGIAPGVPLAGSAVEEVISKLARLARDVLGSEEDAKEWFNKLVPVLGGYTARQLIELGFGEVVSDYLSELRHGSRG